MCAARRSSSLPSFFERAAEGREQRRRVREERVDHLAEELVAAEISQVPERAVVEAHVRRLAAAPPSPFESGFTRFSAAASSSARIGFAT